MNQFNSTRSLILAKLVASAFSLAFLVVLTKYVPGDELGVVLECLFISASLVFLSDQGITPTLVTRQSQEDIDDGDYRLIRHFVFVRFKRTFFVIPLLVVLLHTLTDASTLSIIAVCSSHVATLVYSTVNAGLLGANRRYVEAISEPSSRLFALVSGTALLFVFSEARGSQTVLLIYASADLFMLLLVAVLFSRSKQNSERYEDLDVQIDSSYRLQFTMTSGISSTMGVGETWALSIQSSPSDYAFYSLVARVVDLSGLVASFAGYSHLPQLISVVSDRNWNDLISRCRRIIALSLFPTICLTLSIFIAHIQDISLYGFGFGDDWIPLIFFALSIPAVVTSKYLILTLQSVDPKTTTLVVLLVGSGIAVSVMWMYETFGLSGTFVTLAVANVLRACLLVGLIRHTRNGYIVSPTV